MSLLRSIDSKRLAFIICLSGFLLNLIAYYPGFMSPDSLDQYQQAITGDYNDWHPPIMAGLWHLFNYIYSGPLLMLVFQLSLFWTSIYLLLTAIKGHIWKLSILLLAFAPFIQNFTGYIIKDIQMSFAWLLTSAILFRAIIQQRKLSIFESIISLLLIIYATWIRQNALPGSLPFIVLWTWLVFRQRSKGFKITIVVIATTLLVWLQFPFNYNLFNAEKTYPEVKLYLEDITGIYAKTGQSYFTPYVLTGPAFDPNRLRTQYNTATFDDLWEDYNGKALLPDMDDSSVKDLQKAWLHAIVAHPFTYINNRADGFLYYLRVKNRTPLHYYYPYIDPNPYGFVFKWNLASKLLLKPIAFQKDIFYMRPWFWFLLSVILLFFMKKIRNTAYRKYYILLATSGILYLLPQFLVYQTDTDLRYFYWNILSPALCVCLLIADRKNLQPAK
ncbi:MAG: hypothetical protein ACTHJ0_11370 [Flavipsychrobacter sp.]